MKSILTKCIGLVVVLLAIVLVPTFFSKDDTKAGSIVAVKGNTLDEALTDFNHIGLFGVKMEFPLTMSELPDTFHIKDMYYDEMTDGIEEGDCFHCDLLNDKDEPVAYLRVSNLKKAKASSPDEMTITYISASTYTENGTEYGVPMEIMGGIGIGSTYEEVRKVLPELEVDPTEDYSIATTKQGILTITLEFSKDTVTKLSVEAY